MISEDFYNRRLWSFGKVWLSNVYHGDHLNQNKKGNCGPYIAQIGCCNYPI